MKKILLLTICALMVFAMTAYAKEGKDGPAGASGLGQLNLRAKDPVGPGVGDIIEGAHGKLTYNLEGPEFCYNFRAVGLEPDQCYKLIYYPDPWPGNDLICLGGGETNNGGALSFSDCVDTGDLPAATDDNFGEGAKIWLVVCEDVDCDIPKMVGWSLSGTRNLYEDELITYTKVVAAPSASSTTTTTWASIKSN